MYMSGKNILKYIYLLGVNILIRIIDKIQRQREFMKSKRKNGFTFSRADSSACDIRHYHGNRVSIFYTILESSRVSQK